MLGTQEIIIILALALLVFGPKKLPEIGRSLGSAMRELRRASNDLMSAITTQEHDDYVEPEPVVERTENEENPYTEPDDVIPATKEGE